MIMHWKMQNVVMHCQALVGEREDMYSQIENLERGYEISLLSQGNNNFHTIMGKIPEEQDAFISVQFLKIVAISFDRMYNVVMKSRDGIGKSFSFTPPPLFFSL